MAHIGLSNVQNYPYLFFCDLRLPQNPPINCYEVCKDNGTNKKAKKLKEYFYLPNL